MNHKVAVFVAAALLPLAPAAAQQDPAPASAATDKAAWPEAWFEIFKLAPGKCCARSWAAPSALDKLSPLCNISAKLVPSRHDELDV